MVRLTILLLILASTLTTAGAHAAPAEAPFGKAKNLPISFKVTGGESWCSKGVTVELNAKEAAVLTSGSEEFQQMLGRIRSAIESECQQVRTIGFYGKATNGEVSVGESLKLTDWVYVPFKLDGKRPDCSGPFNAELCEQRWRVFYDIKRFFEYGAFSQGVLTRFLSTQNGADAEFTSGDANGRVAFVPMASAVTFSTAAEFVDQQIEQYAANCEGEVAKYQNEAFNAQTSYQGLTCQSASGVVHSHFVISKLGDGFEVIAFSDFTPGGMSGKRLVAELRAALAGTLVPWADIKINEHNDSPPTLNAGACLTQAEEFSGVGNRPVATRTRAERASQSHQFIIRIDQSGIPKIPRDAWQMRLRNVTQSEKKYLEDSQRFGSWLVYRAVEAEHGYSFENQLFAATSPTHCEAIRSPNEVEVASLPAGIVDIYTDSLDLTKDGQLDKRQSLRQWADSEDLPSQGTISNLTADLPDMSKYPAAITDGWKEFTGDCLTGRGNTVAFEDDFVTSVDMDNDGDLDYVTNGDGILCKSSNGTVLHSGGGNGAVQIMIFNTTKSGVKLAFHDLVGGGFIERHNGFAVFVASYGEITEYHKIGDGISKKLPGVYLGGAEIYSISR